VVNILNTPEADRKGGLPVMEFSMNVYNPGGFTEIINSHAERLDTLNGKTIGELSDGAYEADRTFPVIRRLLQERFPRMKIIPYTEFPVGMAEIDIEGIEEIIIGKGCDAVIVGNAA